METKKTEEPIDEKKSKKVSKSGKHKPLNAFLIVITTIFFLFVMAINYMSSTPTGKDIGLFINQTGDVSDMHYLEITPAGWTFTIWAVIYAWQIVWLIYVIVGLFRKNPDGEPLYANPETQPPTLYLLYLVNLGCNLAWMLLFDRMYIDWCLIPIALLPFTLYLSLIISHVRLMKHGNDMISMGMRKDIWMIRLFIQNGMGIYATWTSIACLLNLAMVITYRLGVDQSLSSSISLSILTMEVVAWFALDNFAFERYTRYLVTPYLVVIFALSGSLAKNFDVSANNTITTLTLIAGASLLSVIKVILLCYRHCTRPVFGDKECAYISSSPRTA